MYDHVILVLKGVSLQVPEGGIVALLGANGAGKSTTLKSISGLLRTERGDVTKGSIELLGEPLQRKNAAEVVRHGIVQVMEGRRSPRRRTCWPAPIRAPTAAPSSRTWNASTPTSRGSRNGGGSTPVTSPEASSRWWRSVARSWPIRGSCCWTSPPWAWRPCWSPRSSTSSPGSTGTRRWPCSWPSRTPPWRSAWPSTPTSWRTGGSCWTATVRPSARTRTSRSSTWGSRAWASARATATSSTTSGASGGSRDRAASDAADAAADRGGVESLRRRPGRDGRATGCDPRRAHVGDRAQRRGEDLAAQHDQRLLPPRQRAHRPR
ncbi:MAG: ATP-binding cassette domain-containing protein [Candidatus Rokubacteria bacterium]|nr:ATP-binding cassette domain-containing protein [Candidatus Rokubacteria bacterium]